MLFVALRYTSYIQHQQQEERRNKPSRSQPPPEESASPQSNNVEIVTRQETLGSELLAGEGVSLG
jgi:hypothetical protein